ncbi:ABC transporter permease [Paracoccus sp. (in: a-proteobacteria)]|uniref:ABC transporter permease n=1 Tax=Paracoccus sp. TaxID=267 RepID=UPI002AFFB22E|nr:hypothetical protein [Paracoccus sp. (in: a-proteobacteria)]
MVGTTPFKKDGPYRIGFANASLADLWLVTFAQGVQYQAAQRKHLIEKFIMTDANSDPAKPVGGVPIWLEDFAYGAACGIPFVAMITIAAFLILGLVLRSARTGQSIYAVGGNPVAAKAVGISVGWVTILAYSASGFFAALAGIYLTCRTGTGDPRVGNAMTLASIVPVVVGGTMLGGGVGTVFGTAIGVALVSVLGNVLNYMNVTTFVQWVVQGIVILAAVSIYVDRSRKL